MLAIFEELTGPRGEILGIRDIRAPGNIDPVARGANIFQGGIPYMRFDADPKELFREWRSDLEFSLRRFKRHPAVEAAMAKLGIALADRLAQLREIVKPYTNTHTPLLRTSSRSAGIP